jgi:hypothetical protein
MIDIDAEQYVKELKEFNATIAMINVGGIIASYKTDLPFHYQSPYLTGDSLQKIIEVCHRENIKVMARNDFSKVRRPLYEQHPEWAYKSAEGAIIDYNGDVHTCVNSDYQTIYAPKIMDEILDKLEIDGVFFNMGGYLTRDYSYNAYGICHCNNCKHLFNKMFGIDLPNKVDMNDSAYRKYRVFQRETLSQYRNEMIELINKKRPDIAINSLDFRRQESNTEFGRALPHWQFSASSNTRWARNTYPEIRSSNTSVDFIGFFYRHVAVNPAQQQLRLWQSLANTGGLDYYLIGRLDNHQDKSGYEGIKKVFEYHQRNEKYYLNLHARADILLVREKDAGSNGEDRGWIRFLTEQHFLFDEVLTEGLDKVELSKYKAIVLADAKYITDKNIKRIDEFSQLGGTVIATGESGLHDGDYEPRKENALKCLGIKGVTTRRDDMRSGMLLIKDRQNYPTFEKWQTEVLYFGDTFLFCKYDEGVQKHLNLIPPHNFGPPERCYYEQITDNPGMVVNHYGKGKGVHIPWFPGAIFQREGYVNTSAYIGDMLENILGIYPVVSNVSPMVEITVADGEGFSLVQFVNTSGHFSTTFYDPISMDGLWVEIPWDKSIKTCISLQDGRDVPYTFVEGKLKIELGKLDFFDAIKIV